MKKIYSIAIAILLFSCAFLFACGPNGLTDNPAIDAAVTSNGGLAVHKGEYVYYVNGFESISGLTDPSIHNVWGKVVKGAIYRTKLVNGKLEKDENGFLQKTEVVVPKLVGYEDGGFYIYGDYIYYTTPNMQRDKNGTLLKNLTNFCRIKIDGTENKVLYTTYGSITKNDYTILNIGGSVYITIIDTMQDENQTSIKALVSVKESGEVKTIKKNVSNAAFLLLDKYYYGNTTAEAMGGNVIEGVTNYIYYTRAINEDDMMAGARGNILARVKLGTETEEVLNTGTIYNYTYSIVEVKNNSVYFTRSSSADSDYSELFMVTIQNGGFSLNNAVTITTTNFDNLYVLDGHTESFVGTDVVLNISNTGLVFKSNSGATSRTLVSGSVTVLAVSDSKILYTQDSKYYVIDARTVGAAPQEVNIQGKSIKTDSNVIADFDGINIYLYASYTAEDNSTNYYLNRICITDFDAKLEFIGCFAEDHTPAEPDNTDKPEDEKEIWIK